VGAPQPRFAAGANDQTGRRGGSVETLPRDLVSKAQDRLPTKTFEMEERKKSRHDLRELDLLHIRADTR